MLLGTWKALLASPAKSVRRIFDPLATSTVPEYQSFSLTLARRARISPTASFSVRGGSTIPAGGRAELMPEAVDEELRRFAEAEGEAPPAAEEAVLDDDHGHFRALGRVRANGMEVDAARVPEESEQPSRLIFEGDLFPEIAGAFLANEPFDPVDAPGVHDLDQGLDAGPGLALRKGGRVLERRGRRLLGEGAGPGEGDKEEENDDPSTGLSKHGEPPRLDQMRWSLIASSWPGATGTEEVP